MKRANSAGPHASASPGFSKAKSISAAFALFAIVAGCAARPNSGPHVLTSRELGARAIQISALQNQVSDLLAEKRYGAALAQLDHLLAIDAQNKYATGLRPLLFERSIGTLDDDESKDLAAEVALDKRMRGMTTFSAKPLEAAIDEMSNRLGLIIEVDWDALDKAGIKSDAPVTVKQLNANGGKVLSVILESAAGKPGAIAYTVRDGGLFISTPDQVGTDSATRVYDIVDNASDIPDFTRAPDFNLQQTTARHGGGGGGLFSSGGRSGSSGMGPGAAGGPVGGKPVPAPPVTIVYSPPSGAGGGGGGGAGLFGNNSGGSRNEEETKTREEVIEDVMRIIQETVDPDSWRDAGGSVGSIRYVHGKLIVTQTNKNQIKVRKMIQRLGIKSAPSRKATPQEEPEQQQQPAPPDAGISSNESYAKINDNPFLLVTDNPLSTFSIDVDTASYSNTRRFLSTGSLPPADAVRIEEFLNYFSYDYQPPKQNDPIPFASNIEVSGCPWNPKHRLVRVALKGKEVPPKARPAANLVFLIDVSGSMNEANKLPLVQKSLRMLVEKLNDGDTVSMVVYAGNSGLVLPATAASKRQEIVDAIEKLAAGGSTNGGEGIQLAYQIATQNFIKNGINRVLLCTDGDFNVGITNQDELQTLIEEKAKSGVYLSVMGFGMGNLKDSTMETLADKGNGNYAYIDTQLEAYKVLVEQMSGTLMTIAKDVKIQVEFNPAQAGSYRLVGYENRLLAKEDFNNDKKDAGEIGAGHEVTALYEVAPPGEKDPKPDAGTVDPLRYQATVELPQKVGKDAPPDAVAAAPASKELLTLKLRYKAPDGDTSKKIEFPFTDAGGEIKQASEDFRFAAAVAEFGMLLRGSEHKGTATFDTAIELATAAKGKDASGYRAEFLELLKKAKDLTVKPTGAAK